LVVYAAVRHLRTILSLILTNSEVRKLLFNFSLISRNHLACGASKAAERLCPDSETLARVDDSAPQDPFVTEGGRTAGPSETPMFDAKVPGTGYPMAQRPKDDLGAGAAVKMENGEVKSGHPEYTDNVIDLVVENFTLSGRNLFANVMLIKFSPYSSITDEHHHEFTLTLR